MKKKLRAFSLIVAAIIAVVCLIEFIYTIREYNYYNDKNSFVQANGIIKVIKVNQRTGSLYLRIENIENEKSFYNDFEVRKQNLKHLEDEGFFSKVKSGDRIQFISAPEIFGDGYHPPVVYINVDGKVYLEFEPAWKELLSSLIFVISFVSIVLLVIFTIFTIFTTKWILAKRKTKKQ